MKHVGGPGDYLRTVKPRIVVLFIVLTASSMVVAGGATTGLMTRTLFGLALAVAGAGALNNYLERGKDALMARTLARPLPAGRVPAGAVLALGCGLVTIGVLELWWQVGYLAALLTAAGAAYYVVVYTLVLKPRSAHGVVPGGLAGLFPPLVGWVATGAPPSPTLGLLLALVFLWSPPHFWALALARAEDYRRAGFPTLAARAGEQAARLSITAYVAAILLLTMLPYPMGLLGFPYLLGALAGALLLVLPTLNLFRDGQTRAAWLVYKLSGPYLALLLAAMVLDTLASSPPVVALREGVSP